MAKELSEQAIENLHKSLEGGLPLIHPKGDWNNFNPYRIAGDFADHLYARYDTENAFNNCFVAALLILAAEGELDGYPMEAADEQVS